MQHQQIPIEIREELWRRGVLNWKLRDCQKKIYDDILSNDELIFVLNTARRFGKSTILLIIALELVLQKKDARVRYCATTLDQVSKVCSDIFPILMEDCPQDLKPKHDQVHNSYKFPNRSILYLAGSNNGYEDSSRGMRADMCIVDEAAYVDRLEYLVSSVLLPQTIDQVQLDGTNHGRLILSSTPSDTPNHPYRDYYEKARLKHAAAKYTIWDNTHLSKETIDLYADEQGGYTSTKFRREYLCEFVVEEDKAILPEWQQLYSADRSSHLLVMDTSTLIDGYYPYYHKFLTMDLGVKHYTVILFGYYDFLHATIVIQKEWYMNGPQITTDLIADVIRNTEYELWGRKPPYLRVADNNNPLLLNDLGILHDMPVLPTSKDSIFAMVNELRMVIKNKRLIIDKNCPFTIGCIESGIWDKNRRKFDESITYGHYDAIAALVYLVRNIDEQANPVPDLLEFNPDKQFLNPSNAINTKPTDNALVLNELFA